MGFFLLFSKYLYILLGAVYVKLSRQIFPEVIRSQLREKKSAHKSLFEIAVKIHH